ncbi:nicotinamide riboside kinase 2-like, partial [Tropilaelaps mercedesae]
MVFIFARRSTIQKRPSANPRVIRCYSRIQKGLRPEQILRFKTTNGGSCQKQPVNSPEVFRTAILSSVRKMVVGDGFLVIAVSGVTNGGKTSLIERLRKEFPEAGFVSQDTFFFSEEDPRHQWLQTETFRHQNWELPSAIDFVLLKSKVRSLTCSGSCLPYRILLIEGHVIFADLDIVAWSDKKYFFTLTKEQCKERRERRTYQPADPPGYFDLCIYPEYLKYLSMVKKHVKDVEYLDGAGPQDVIFQKVLNDIRPLL